MAHWFGNDVSTFPRSFSNPNKYKISVNILQFNADQIKIENEMTEVLTFECYIFKRFVYAKLFICSVSFLVFMLQNEALLKVNNGHTSITIVFSAGKNNARHIFFSVLLSDCWFITKKHFWV